MTIVHHFFSSATTSCRLIMLQNRTLHNFPGTCLMRSQFRTADKVGKFPQKLGVCNAYTRLQPKVLRIKSEQNFCPLRIHADGPGTFSPFTFQPKLRLGLSKCGMQRKIFSYGIFLLDYCCLASISKRSFSNVPGALTNKNESFGMKDGGKRSSPSFRPKNKWNKAKAIAAACRRNSVSNEASGYNISKLRVSATKGDDMVYSKDQLLVDDKINAKLDPSSSDGYGRQKPKAKEKLKQQSRSKASKGQPSDANAASDEVNEQNISKKSSKSKKPPSLAKNNLSDTASEVNKIKTNSTEASERNVSTNDHPKPKANEYNRKQKTNKEASALVKSDIAVTDSSNRKLLKSQRSDTSNKTRPQGHSKFPQLYPPTAKSVVVVESLTKAKVIQGYLGDMFEVLPSHGHVRDLAARSGSVRPDDEFSMVWEVPSAAWTHLKSIKVALSGVKNLVLASDLDREGEAIAWHIVEMLQQQDALRDNISVVRVVFNEITESSIKRALQSPREIDLNLVHGYLARRALDYLIGFNISPLLWRKLPGCQSAGRVQSAALSLICDREKEIDDFKPQEYWTVEVKFRKKDSNLTNVFSFPSHLSHLDGQKLNQLAISSDAEANNIEQQISSSTFEVVASKKSKSCRNPPTPYITSSLQQDAANKLNFTAAYTMKLAQKLYEGIQLSDDQAAGLITYMRTDGLHISDDARKDIWSFVIERYGQNFASRSAQKYFKKVKNAQEAHEAIRPTNIRRLPSMLSGVLDEDSLKLYTLIWSRTVACQMQPATIDHIQLDIGNSSKSIVLHSSSSRVEFLGYQAVFKDRESDAVTLDENEGNNPGKVFEVLSSLKSGDFLNLDKVELQQHHTSPPARYSEGALIKKLEELGIGRPSTYATTIKVLKDRNYIAVKCRILYPEFRGRMVSAFLSHYFSEVTDYSFTADMETELDNVSAGLTEWKGLLSDYWTRFSKYCERAGNVHIHQVEKMLEKAFGNFLFAFLPNGSRACPSCSEGTLIFKVSRFGAGYFIGCDQHPKCKYIAKTLYGKDDEDITSDDKNKNVDPPKLLGLNPGSNERVLLKNGPYGYYVQLGEDSPGYLPKRASISKIKDVDSITLEDALELLRYPVTLGKHPDDGSPVMILNKKGGFGFAIKHRRTRAPVPKNMKPSDITLEKALKLLLSKDATKTGRPKSRPKVEESIEAT